MEVKHGYKKTELGLLPEAWESVRLADLCIKIQDGTHFSPKIGGNDYLYLTSKHVRFGYLDASNADRIDAAQHEAIYKRCDVKTGDLLLTKDGANTGNAALNYMTEPFSLLSSVAFLRFDAKKHSAAYFLQQILSAEGQRRIKEAMSGNAITRLTLEKIRRLQFPVAPLHEQLCIAEVLGKFDALLLGLEKLIAKKSDLKQAAMQQLLTGQTRLPGFTGDWVKKKLGDLARIQRGASPRPIESPIWFDNTSSIGWVRIADVTSAGMFLTETEQRLSPIGVKNSRPVAKHNLIMSICATVGRPIITEIDVCIHDGFVVFAESQVEILYLYYALKRIEPDWSKCGQTGSQMNLNTAIIAGRTIDLPPRGEQVAIGKLLQDMDEEIASIERCLAKNRSIKQGMMQELLTGRTRST